MSYRTQKALVQAHHAALADATPDTVSDVLAERTTPDWLWRGMHPWHEQTGAQAVARTFWVPFLLAFRHVQRRQDIFFAGHNEIDGFTSVWTVSMGHLMGLFDAPFVGIPPHRRLAMLRYAEFNRIEGGLIAETALFVDLLQLMHQTGLRPLASAPTGAHLVQPGPLTHDGVQVADAPPAEGTATLALINRMIGDIARNSNDGSGRQPFDLTPQIELARCWHEDMLWWGPDGIGATYTIDRYIEQHQRPFREHLTDRRFNGHVCRMAEGAYGGFFGWPNLTLRPTGGFMGLPASGRTADMRVVDLYRRDGDKLAENWIFADILYFLLQQGFDLLGDIGKA